MTTCRRLLLVLLAAACVFAPLEASLDIARDSPSASARSQQFRQPPPYRILVSNDDGVRAPGLAAVAQALQAIGTPIVVAPADNQTGKGHSIATAEPVLRQDLTLPNGLPAIGLSTTPATTVNIAIRNILNPAPDLVVSGVNPGYNFGHSIHMSGTVGAARMAAMLGVPAIAISQAAEVFQKEMVFAAEEAIWVARRVKAWGLPPGTFLNVNVPPMPPGGYKGYMITTQAMSRGGEESFAEQKNPRGQVLYWNLWKEGGTAAEGTDMWAVANGWVSVTPMTVDTTDPKQFNALKEIFK
jgi:5'-nucleotidase